MCDKGQITLYVFGILPFCRGWGSSMNSKARPAKTVVSRVIPLFQFCYLCFTRAKTSCPPHFPVIDFRRFNYISKVALSKSDMSNLRFPRNSLKRCCQTREEPYCCSLIGNRVLFAFLASMMHWMPVFAVSTWLSSYVGMDSSRFRNQER